MVNKQVLAVAATLFAQQSAALSLHRGAAHAHLHEKKAADNVVVVTDWTTVTVIEDGSSRQTLGFFKANHHHTASTSAVVVPTTSSSTTPSTTTTTSSSTSTPSTTSTSTTPSVVVAAVPTTTLATSYAKPATTSSSANAVASAVQDVANVVNSVTSAVAAAVTSATSTASSGQKRGLAYNAGSLLSVFLNSGTKCSWSYNWGAEADSAAPSDVEYVPMLWSPGKADDWSTKAEAAIASGSKYLLSFNECDNAGQCNLDAASAATAHQKYFKDFSGRAEIGTPAITNSQNSGEGIDWLKSFLESCNGNCAYDFCPLHWYNGPDATEFLSHVSQVYETCGKKVWITEFAPTGSDDEINSFLVEVMDQLDNNSTYSFVERYSYFMAATGSLLTSTTSLSTYGQTYAYQ